MGPYDPNSCAEQQIPLCTGEAKACDLCDFIRQIYAGFPSEVDPGCERKGEDERVQERRR